MKRRERVLRTQAAASYLILGLVWFAVSTTILLANLDELSAGDVAIGLAINVVIVTGFALWARPAVHIHPDRVRIVNPLRTREIRWDKISRFSVEPHPIHDVIGVVNMGDGSEFRIVALHGHPLGRKANQFVREQVEDLNQLLAQAGQKFQA